MEETSREDAPPPAHPNVESFFVVEVEKGDVLERRMCATSACMLTPEDLAVTKPACRLRTTADWVVVEASSEAPPCLVIGADGDGRRGVACAFDVGSGTPCRERVVAHVVNCGAFTLAQLPNAPPGPRAYCTE